MTVTPLQPEGEEADAVEDRAYEAEGNHSREAEHQADTGAAVASESRYRTVIRSDEQCLDHKPRILE